MQNKVNKNKRKLPEWLLCKEKCWAHQPIPLYQQAWMKAYENGQLNDWPMCKYRTCFPAFEVEYVTSTCIRFDCDLYDEPHIHSTMSTDILFYSACRQTFIDLVQLPLENYTDFVLYPDTLNKDKKMRV